MTVAELREALLMFPQSFEVRHYSGTHGGNLNTFGVALRWGHPLPPIVRDLCDSIDNPEDYGPELADCRRYVVLSDCTGYGWKP